MVDQYLRNIYDAYEKVGGVKEGPRGWCTKYNVPKSTLNKAIRKYSTSQNKDNRGRNNDGRFVKADNVFAADATSLVGGNLTNKNGESNDGINEKDQSTTRLGEVKVHPPSKSFTIFSNEMEKAEKN